MILTLPYQPTQENASRIADFIVEKTHETYEVILDYQPESLAFVDQIIENMRRNELSLDEAGTDLFCYGCYVGEVFLRSEGGQWKNTSETNIGSLSGLPLVIEMPNGNIGNPIGKVYKCFANGMDDNLTFFYHAFRKMKDR